MKGASDIDTAMVLAAGLGTRMRPITNTLPKPLVEVMGKPLLDHALDSLIKARIDRAIVNVHHLAEQIEAHLKHRSSPAVDISDEREQLLDSGGGVKRAMVGKTDGPFVILNSDSFWIDAGQSNLAAMIEAWDASKIDMLLLIARKELAVGFEGPGDFFRDEDGVLSRRGDAPTAPWVYAGALIAKTDHFACYPADRFSLNELFDRAISRKRLYGYPLDGLWLHVGTPGSIVEAEQAIERFVSQPSARGVTPAV